MSSFVKEEMTLCNLLAVIFLPSTNANTPLALVVVSRNYIIQYTDFIYNLWVSRLG